MKYRKFLCLGFYKVKGFSKWFWKKLIKRSQFMCNNNFIFVDKSSISNIHLFDDGVHLVESSRCILADHVIDCIICY